MKESLQPEKIVKWVTKQVKDYDASLLLTIANYKSPLINTQMHGYVYVPERSRSAAAAHQIRDRVPLTGVTTVMRDHVHAHIKKRRRSWPRSQLRPEERHERERMAIPGPLGAYAGAELGKLVHRQISSVVTMDESTFMANNRHGLHPLAHGGLRAMTKAHQWRLLRMDLEVFDLERRVATELDLWAVNRRGDFIAGEVKTGYRGDAFTQPDGEVWRIPALRELATRGLWPCTPLTRAMIQIMLGGDMARRMFKIPVKKMHMYVVHIPSAQRVTFYRVDKRFYAHLIAVLWDAIAG